MRIEKHNSGSAMARLSIRVVVMIFAIAATGLLAAESPSLPAVEHANVAIDLSSPVDSAETRNLLPTTKGMRVGLLAREGLFVSRPIAVPIASPSPFLAVTAAWRVEDVEPEQVTVEVRGSATDEAWGPWEVIPLNGDVWTGTGDAVGVLAYLPKETRFVQFRVTLPYAMDTAPTLTSLRAEFISPGASPAPPLAEPSGEPATLLAVSKPGVVTRSGWSCPEGQSSPSWTPQYTTVSHLIVHHTDNSNSLTDWPAVVRSIWSFHKNTNGWGDIGYNYLVDPNGVIYEGRAGGDNVIGAHFSCANGRTMGVAFLGTFTSAQPTSAAWSSVARLLAWKADQRGINPLGVSNHTGTQLNLYNISGHRDANSTTASGTCPSGTVCPGNALYPRLPDLRNDVAALINPPVAPSNDSCANATTLTSNQSCSYTSGTVMNATASGVSKPSCDSASSPDMFDVWYRFTAAATSHTITVDPDNSVGDPVVAVYGSCAGSSLGCRDDGAEGDTETLTVQGLTVGNTYHVRVYDFGTLSPTGTDASFRICVTHTAPPQDTTAPSGSIAINSGASYTKLNLVTLNVSASDAGGVVGHYVSNSPSTPSAGQAGWTSVSSTTSLSTTINNWVISSPDGSKTVYAWFKDAAGNVSNTSSDSITLDQTPPANGTLTATPGNAEVVLSWSGQTDSSSGTASRKLVYSTGGAPPSDCSGSTLATSSPYTHGGLTNGQSYSYRVCATDNAGNTSSGATASATPTGVTPPPGNPTRYDHNADGKADIFWRNVATGQNWMYRMNGNVVDASLSVNAEGDFDWEIAGVADFDGDAKSDIFWRNSRTGVNWLYRMDGNVPTGQYINSEGNLSWKVAGVADFDGDSKADILWRNSSTGQNWMYRMSGNVILASQYVQGEADLNWKVAAVADFDGDTRADILWRHALTGQNWMYLMNGNTVVASLPVNVEGDLNWVVVAAADFDNDDKADILWRHNLNGINFLYKMNGNLFTGLWINAEGNFSWRIANVADYNGDGKADILWRNTSTGQNWLYQMNGNVIAAGLPVQGEGNQSWKVVR